MNTPKDHKPSLFFPIKGFIVVSLLHIIYWLPNPLTHAIGRFFGWLSYQLSARKRHIILTNLSIAFPEMPLVKKLKLAKQSAIQAGMLLSEFPDAWLASRQKIEQQIIEVENAELATEIQANKLPLVVIAPHIGNWEFLVQWVQLNYSMIGLYSPSKIPQVDRLIYDARKKFGCKPYSTDSKGIMQLLRGLKQGGFMMMLPDQVPRENAGIYTPFFGQPAYTMTLLHKLVKKSQAKVLFASCIRRQDKMGFDIAFETAHFDAAESDVAVFNQNMNRQIEAIICRHPEQYVWDYKRFRRLQDGSDPYKG
jgi:KDO2-lipid IV(A) lauroyltransferase